MELLQRIHLAHEKEIVDDISKSLEFWGIICQKLNGDFFSDVYYIKT